MISAPKKAGLKTRPAAVMKELARLRREMDDLRDYLDTLDARAKNGGKPRLTTAQVKAELGI